MPLGSFSCHPDINPLLKRQQNAKQNSNNKTEKNKTTTPELLPISECIKYKVACMRFMEKVHWEEREDRLRREGFSVNQLETLTLE